MELRTGSGMTEPENGMLKCWEARKLGGLSFISCFLPFTFHASRLTFHLPLDFLSLRGYTEDCINSPVCAPAGNGWLGRGLP